MIVCVCKSVSSKRIRPLIEGGADFDELQMELGVALCCGKCESSVREMLNDTPCAGARQCAAAPPPGRVHPVAFYEREAA